MTQPHADRGHAEWSASSTTRNWNCSGAIALVRKVNPPERESEAAAWGTACHQVSEKCLRGSFDADVLIGSTETTKEHSFEVDEEMAETAQTYIDYVRSRVALEDDAHLWIEERFSLASMNPPFEAGGTADAIIYLPEQKLLEVIDLKGGRGVVVEAANNKQMRTYALGAMLAHNRLAVDRVKSTIVQPRAPHKDGRIRSEEFHIVDLMEWTTDLMAAMRRAKEALDAFPTLPLDAWAAKHLNCGSHCTFCPVEGPTCPAQEQKVMETARVWFNDLDQPVIENQPDRLSPEQLAKMLDLADMIENWVGACRSYAHMQAENGVEIPDYILVQKQGREKWSDEAAVRQKLAAVEESLWLNPGKLRTPKQIRDALKKSGLSVDLDGMSSTPVTGTNLVRADKTSRKSVKPKANQFFDVLD